MRELTKVAVAFIALIIVIGFMTLSMKLVKKYRTVVSNDVNATVISSIHMEPRKETKKVTIDGQIATQVNIFDEVRLARMHTEDGYVVTCEVDQKTYESIPGNPFFTVSMTHNRISGATTCFNVKSIEMNL